MVWWFVTAFLSVINTFVYQTGLQKAVSLGSSSVFRVFFLNGTVVLIIGVLWLFLEKFLDWNFAAYLDPKLFALTLAMAVWSFIATLLTQYSYVNEKAWILAPYGEISRIATVILWFLVFSNSSVSTFVSALVAAAFIIGLSVDFKRFSFNKYCVILSGAGLLRAVISIGVAYVITKTTSMTFIFMDSFYITCFLLVALAFRWGFPKGDRKGFVEMTAWILGNNAIWIVSYAISLFLIKDIWLVATSLLGTITLVLTVVLDSVFSKRFPTGKNLMLTWAVVLCILGWSVFN